MLYEMQYKHDRPVNFYISLEKPIAKNRGISAMVSLNTTKFGTFMQTEFSSVYASKQFNFKNPRWRTTDALERPFLHHHGISQFFSRR